MEQIIDFLAYMIEGMLDLFRLLPACVTMLLGGIGNLPQLVVPFAISSISIAIILLVLGRQNNS